MRLGDGNSDQTAMPRWVPDAVRAYIVHTRDGQSIRQVARHFGCEPSTISRRVRRVENRRDDVLVDLALARLGNERFRLVEPSRKRKEAVGMSQHDDFQVPDDDTIEREARRILRRLAEPGACMALAPAMDNAVVVRESGDGPALRTAVVERTVAEAMALKEWIDSTGSGRILRYRITAAGRAELRRIVAKEESARAMRTGVDYSIPENRGGGFSEAPAARKTRYSLAESPLVTLARRRDKDGKPFLSEDLVAAGERLREDFELAQVGPKVAQSWDSFMTGPGDTVKTSTEPGQGASAARDRVAQALRALGPGLGDVALRCCCYLEGLETAEQRMGWSARSGKIVLRIALQRLKLHYDENSDHWSPLIG